MAPPRNLSRRNALTDAAIEILGTRGIHQLSHRAVDEAAGLPAGTTSNYFRSRDALLDAVAQRIADLHLAEMAASVGLSDLGLADLIGGSLYAAATTGRVRYLAVFELSLEATRRPWLMDALSRIESAALEATVGHHRGLGLGTSAEQVQTLMTLFGGALFALVTGPPEAVTLERTRELARSMVRGTIAT
jgi:DNA-binding transcriptional regulator YbjK